MNTNTENQITLHSGSGCVLDKTAKAVARILGTSCESSDGNNAGCAYQQTGNTSYGHGFNLQAGGVFAHTLEADGISVWYFDRDAIPSDIQSKKPDPASWGTPTAFFPNTQCDILSHFLAQNLIFDITVCGDWAGPAYASSGCPKTCNDAVADPSNFDGAFLPVLSSFAVCLRFHLPFHSRTVEDLLCPRLPVEPLAPRLPSR